MTPEQQAEKVAQAQDKMFEEVYLPAFVEQYQIKAAAAGLPALQSVEELEQALNLVAVMETKQAEEAQVANPLTKAAQAVFNQTQTSQESDERAIQFAKAASENEGLITAIKEIVE